MLRRVPDADLFFRRMRTGDRLGSRFHRSRWFSARLPKPLLQREPDRDLLFERERDLFLDFDRLLLSGVRDFLRRPRERDLDFFFFLGDLDFERLLLVPDLCDFLSEGERDFREGDLDFFFFAGDFDLDRAAALDIL